MSNPIKSEASNRKVSNLLIDRDFQLRYIVWSLVIGVFLTTLFGSICHFFLQQHQQLLTENLNLGPADAEELRKSFKTLFLQLILGCVVLMGLITGFALKISHRAAGPLYHFKRVFDEITRGNRSERVRLRPKDDFQEVAKSFNAMMDSLTGPSAPKSE